MKRDRFDRVTDFLGTHFCDAPALHAPSTPAAQDRGAETCKQPAPREASLFWLLPVQKESCLLMKRPAAAAKRGVFPQVVRE